MKDGSKKFRTTSITLAAYLKLEGCDEYRMFLDDEHDDIGGWEFDHTADLAKLVAIYEGREARVEPQEFHPELSRTRGELFNFLRQEGVWEESPKYS